MKPCFKTRFASDEISLPTVKVVIPAESLTIKSPRLLSEESRILNWLPATSPCAVLVVIVVIPTSASNKRALTLADGPILNTY